jgi:hypothetical protein
LEHVRRCGILGSLRAKATDANVYGATPSGAATVERDVVQLPVVSDLRSGDEQLRDAGRSVAVG